MDGGAWWATVHGVAESRTRLSDFTFTFHSYALEKEMATNSSVLALRIPWRGEPGGLPSMGSHRVGHDWSNLAAAAAAFFLFTLFKSKIFTKVPLHRNDQKIGLILKRGTAETDIRHCYRGWTNQRDWHISSTQQSQPFADASTIFHLGPQEAQAQHRQPTWAPGVDSLSPPSELLWFLFLNSGF